MIYCGQYDAERVLMWSIFQLITVNGLKNSFIVIFPGMVCILISGVFFHNLREYTLALLQDLIEVSNEIFYIFQTVDKLVDLAFGYS